MGGFFFDLSHPDHIPIVVEPLEGGRLVIKLVAENDREVTNAGHTLMTPGRSAEGQNVSGLRLDHTTSDGF